VANVIDPLGGSWFVESLTDTMERRANDYFDRIERLGGNKGMLAGVLAGIDRGWFQQEIADAAWRQQVQLEKKRRVVVGVNDFVETVEQPLDTLHIGVEIEREQVAFLANLRLGRDEDVVTKALHSLTEAARGSDNLLPLIIDAARASATEGEIINALKEVFGEYREAPRF
jgi:methylmalonyl-CoA mutase, N-terminal domain